jgi:alpha-methylacyl-CoA racemase
LGKPATRCSRLLADYGARVVKVGAPPKKSGVQVQPAFWAYSAGRDMKQVRVDLKAPEGRDALLALAESADVWIESYRPGVAARLGVGYEDVRARNPRIVYCSTSGYGQTGPASQWAGHDLNYLAVAGFLHTSGRRGDGGPPLPGATVADSAAGGMHAALAIFAALLRRERTGVGEYLDVAVADGVLSLMSLYLDQHLATGALPGPGHDILTGRYACYDTYRARDGRWLSVAAIEPHFFANLCKALSCEQWLPSQLDDGAQEAMRRDFAAAFATRDRDDWVAELAPANTCVAPVNDIREVASDAQFASRGAFVTARHPGEGEFRQVSQVLAGMQPLPGPVPVRDASVTDTAELLASAGIPEEQLEAMRRDGVIA